MRMYCDCIHAYTQYMCNKYMVLRVKISSLSLIFMYCGLMTVILRYRRVGRMLRVAEWFLSSVNH